MEKGTLAAGVRLKEVATAHTHYQNCSVLHSNAIGLVMRTWLFVF